MELTLQAPVQISVKLCRKRREKEFWNFSWKCVVKSWKRKNQNWWPTKVCGTKGW